MSPEEQSKREGAYLAEYNFRQSQIDYWLKYIEVQMQRIVKEMFFVDNFFRLTDQISISDEARGVYAGAQRFAMDEAINGYRPTQEMIDSSIEKWEEWIYNDANITKAEPCSE